MSVMPWVSEGSRKDARPVGEATIISSARRGEEYDGIPSSVQEIPIAYRDSRSARASVPDRNFQTSRKTFQKRYDALTYQDWLAAQRKYALEGRR